MGDSLESRLAVASSFILQSPPGEVNDVFNDVRALVGDDAALESGILPALAQYNLEQFVVAALPESQQLLICSTGQVSDEAGETRYIDPCTSKAWLFDHLRLSASEAREVLRDEECEKIRAELQAQADKYGEEHFSEGTSKVFTVEQTRLKALPKPKKEVVAPASAITPEGKAAEVDEAAAENVENPVLEDTPAKIAADDDESTNVQSEGNVGEPAVSVAEDSDAAMAAATPAPEEEALASTTDDVDMQTSETVPEEEAGTVQIQQAVLAEKPEPDATEGAPGSQATAADAVMAQEEEQEEAEAEAPLEPLARKFALYFVGNKYNPSNYWTGRWRSSYELDMSVSPPTLSGSIRLNVHFFEQGNVQLSTSFSPTFSLAASATPADVLKAIKKAEEEYQLELNETYREMSEKTYKSLRRALPIRRQKMDWAKVASYRLQKDIGGQA